MNPIRLAARGALTLLALASRQAISYGLVRKTAIAEERKVASMSAFRLA